MEQAKVDETKEMNSTEDRVQGSVIFAIRLGKTVLMAVLLVVAVNLTVSAYQATRAYLQQRLAAYIDSEVNRYEVEFDPKKGTVKNIGELDKGVLARQLFVTSTQYGNCLEAMAEIRATSGFFKIKGAE